MTKFLRNQFPIIILSLALSFMLWLFVSGEDKTYHDLPVALDLQNVPAWLDLGDAVPDTLSLRVNANRAQASYLDSRRLRLVAEGGGFEAGLNTVSFDASAISPPLPQGIEVLRLTPDTLTIMAYPYVTKEVPVQVPERGAPRDYLERGEELSVEPPVAKVTGPENRLETVTVITTAPLDWSEIRSPGDSADLAPQTSALDGRLTVSPSSFRATPRVTVRREQRSFDVPLRLEDEAVAGSRSSGVTLDPPSVRVTVSWPLNLPVPQPDSDGGIRATVSVDPGTLARRRTLRLDVLAVPPNQVRLVGVEPAKVRAVWVEPEAPAAPAPAPAPADPAASPAPAAPAKAPAAAAPPAGAPSGAGASDSDAGGDAGGSAAGSEEDS
jgi:hypothetical protein